METQLIEAVTSVQCSIYFNKRHNLLWISCYFSFGVWGSSQLRLTRNCVVQAWCRLGEAPAEGPHDRLGPSRHHVHEEALAPKQLSFKEFALYCMLCQMLLLTLGLAAASGKLPALRTCRSPGSRAIVTLKVCQGR